MAYYLRFLCEDDRPLVLKEILSGLRNTDPRFQLDRHGRLTRGGELLAQLDLSCAGDELFEAEVGELQELARQGGPDGAAIARRLESVTAVLAVGVLWQEREAERTLGLLSPLWDWLLANRRGLIQADGEGFYEGQNLILEP
jgi:hypothetical protein